MVQIIKNIIFFGILQCILFALDSNRLIEIKKSTIETDLVVYDGRGSILISWSIPDSIAFDEVRVFSKNLVEKNLNYYLWLKTMSQIILIWIVFLQSDTFIKLR